MRLNEKATRIINITTMVLIVIVSIIFFKLVG